MNESQETIARRWFDTAGPVPEFVVPETLSEWLNRRERTRSELWRCLGKLPPRRIEGEVRVLFREDLKDYLLEKFEFDNGAGSTVPGYLLLPANRSGKVPAILYCHWHGDEYDLGKEELFRSDRRPEAAGPALVRQGYAVMCIDAYGFGERNGKGPGGEGENNGNAELTASKFNLWMGRSLWGMILRDDLLAFDYLISRIEIDSSRVGVTGISMGATRTWWLLALEEKLKSGVAVACMTRYQDLILSESLRAHGIYYFVPGLLNLFDTEAIVSLAAPRPLLFLTGDSDPGSPVDGMRIIADKVQSMFDLYGKPDLFQSVTFKDTGHSYLPEMWSRMLEWMDRHVKGGRESKAG